MLLVKKKNKKPKKLWLVFIESYTLPAGLWRLVNNFAPNLICCFLTEIARLVIHNAEIKCHFIHRGKAEQRTKGWHPAADESHSFLPLLTSKSTHQAQRQYPTVTSSCFLNSLIFKCMSFPDIKNNVHSYVWKCFLLKKFLKLLYGIWVPTYELQSNIQNKSLNLIVGLKCVRKKLREKSRKIRRWLEKEI